MPEAVIVATARTPIGRAFKGSLVDMRPDDLTALIVGALLEKVPELDPHSVEDLMVGCGQPAGESGFNLARVVAILAGLATGVWRSAGELKALRKLDRAFRPQMKKADRDRLVGGWRAAVARTLTRAE